MYRAKRGYSLVMWVVVFAVVISAIVMFITPVKRAITGKILKTTDYALWGVWGDQKQDEGGWNHNQIGELKSDVSQGLEATNAEDKGKVSADLDATSNYSSTYSSY